MLVYVDGCYKFSSYAKTHVKMLTCTCSYVNTHLFKCRHVYVHMSTRTCSHVHVYMSTHTWSGYSYTYTYGVLVQRGPHRHHTHLTRAEPQRPLAGVGLAQDGDHALHRSEDGPVYDHRPLLLAGLAATTDNIMFLFISFFFFSFTSIGLLWRSVLKVRISVRSVISIDDKYGFLFFFFINQFFYIFLVSFCYNPS